MTERSRPATDAIDPFADETGEELWDAAERKAGAIRAAALKARAAAGGLRFEAYLPPDMAVWLLDLIERGSSRTQARQCSSWWVNSRSSPLTPICGANC